MPLTAFAPRVLPAADVLSPDILLPRLPTAERLLPFLARIDSARTYSNSGPLWREFRAALAGYATAATGAEAAVTLTSNGTAAIELALRARALAGREVCLMPSYTFVASAHAAANSGLRPCFLDVDPQSLALTPAIAEAAMATLAEPPAAVLVVTPFGAPPDVAAWAEFERRSGVPVVHDAAAALTNFDALGPQPLCFSLHATKVFGVGEGGAVVSTDRALVDRVTAMSGFGFIGPERTSVLRGGNFRMSEYAAAIGLAALGEIDAKVARLRRVGEAYLGALAGTDLRVQDGVGSRWVTMTFNVVVPARRVGRVLARLTAGGIPWRRWYGLGCHAHPAFAGCPSTPLPVTADLAPRVIGLPFHEDLSEEQIALVCRAIG